jgi:hypothetical protein
MEAPMTILVSIPRTDPFLPPPGSPGSPILNNQISDGAQSMSFANGAGDIYSNVEAGSPLLFTTMAGVAQNALLAENFNWATNSFELQYTIPAGAAFFFTKVGSSSVMSLLSTIPGIFKSNNTCLTGWSAGSLVVAGGQLAGSIGGAQGSVSVGLAKNTTGSYQPYFIGQFQAGMSNISGDLKSSLSIVQSGICRPGDIIGIGGTIAGFPNFPKFTLTTTPITYLTCNFYFTIIGQTPVPWAASQGIPFGPVFY